MTYVISRVSTGFDGQSPRKAMAVSLSALGVLAAVGGYGAICGFPNLASYPAQAQALVVAAGVTFMVSVSVAGLADMLRVRKEAADVAR